MPPRIPFPGPETGRATTIDSREKERVVPGKFASLRASKAFLRILTRLHGTSTTYEDFRKIIGRAAGLASAIEHLPNANRSHDLI
jgi:hypothetical protein